jgi:hypothetical protein
MAAKIISREPNAFTDAPFRELRGGCVLPWRMRNASARIRLSEGSLDGLA